MPRIRVFPALKVFGSPTPLETQSDRTMVGKRDRCGLTPNSPLAVPKTCSTSPDVAQLAGKDRPIVEYGVQLGNVDYREVLLRQVILSVLIPYRYESVATLDTLGMVVRDFRDPVARREHLFKRPFPMEERDGGYSHRRAIPEAPVR